MPESQQPTPKKRALRARVRKIVLTIHLILGLTAGLVIVVIGLTGAALAFNNDYGRWTNRAYFGVESSGAPIGHDAVIAKIETEYAPSKVESINLHFDDEYVYYYMNDRGPLIASTIDGRILDPRAGEAFTSKLVINATQLHTKLMMGDVGRLIRNIVTLEVLLLIPTGVYLWWPVKRFGIKSGSSGFRKLWDLHNTIGAAIALPILFLAITGSLIALRLPEQREPALPNQSRTPPPRSIQPADATQRIAAPLDAALAAAAKEFPELKTYQIMLPESPSAPIVVNKSPAGWSTRNQRTTVYVDQYTGAVLHVNPGQSFTPAYKLYDLGRRLHGGASFGFIGKAIFGASSLSFSVLAITGLALGIRKLLSKKRRTSST